MEIANREFEQAKKTVRFCESFIVGIFPLTDFNYSGSSRFEVFSKIDIPKKFAKFIRKKPYWSPIFTE